MTEWYYADGQDRQGPLSADELRLRFQRAQISLATLVWREGYPQWKPLAEAVDELQLQNLASAADNLGNGIDLRGDYTAIDNGTAPLPGTGGGTHSPYTAPTSGGPYADPMVVSGGDVVYAGFWKRFAAATIDGVVMSGVLVLVFLVGMLMFGGMAAFMGGLSDPEDSPGMAVFIVLGVYVLPVIVQALYFSLMHASTRQATLGKMAVGIKVVRTDGQRLSNGRSFGRWAALFFSYLLSCGLAYLASAIMAGVTQRKQGLHDMIVDTLVVDKWAYTDQPQLQRRELGTVTLVIIGLTALAVLAYAGLIVMTIVMAAAQS
ncbi:RDD family protein [Stenotrophomonas sp.]|uniref:RDD family protein n=1 Tax=Stenotrophomonas sp. TaxID=69392 RepID=UPI002FC80720